VVIAEFFNKYPSLHSWSAPCKLITPHLDSLRTQFSVSVARVDADRSEELSSKFDIHALPSFVLLRKASGEVSAVEMVVGAHVEKLKRLFENASNIKSNKS
jgi:thioredoxin-like negative regulator of GroEL